MKNLAGLVYGPSEHHLDHIAPLCLFFDIPLIVTEPDIEKMALEFYPKLVVYYKDYQNLGPAVIDSFDCLITALAKPLFESIFFLSQTLSKKEINSIWCPHGNSDKGLNDQTMNALSKERFLFVYGQRMQEFMHTQNAINDGSHIFSVGNYRKTFFDDHLHFYEKLAEKHVFSQFEKKQTTILYAPTWEDLENGSSAKKVLPFLLKGLPGDKNLIVKLHPNMLLDDDIHLKKLLWEFEDAPNILFLEKFPLIYPLCDKVDIYLGDTSSIGYDFLAFDRPMIFLNMKKNFNQRFLQTCGINLNEDQFPDIIDHLTKSLEKPEEYSSQRQKAYQHTFDETPNFLNLKTELLRL